MARVNTKTTYDVELTEEEKGLLDSGKRIPIELPDGNVIRVAPPGGDINTRVADETEPNVTEVGGEDDASAEEIEELVNEAQRETTPAPNGGDTEGDDENPRGGGMIDIDRAGE